MIHIYKYNDPVSKWIMATPYRHENTSVSQALTSNIFRTLCTFGMVRKCRFNAGPLLSDVQFKNVKGNVYKFCSFLNVRSSFCIITFHVWFPDLLVILLRKRLGVTGTDFSFDHSPDDSLVQMTGFEEGAENDSFALDAWLFQQVRFSQPGTTGTAILLCLPCVC